MPTLPTVNFCGKTVTRLTCGGNPISGFSHYSGAWDKEMVEYYTAANVQKLWKECAKQGINTIQCRADRHIMRAYIEHRQTGGTLQWIAQTATEHANILNNIAQAAQVGAIAIYHHGTHTDNCWHDGKIDSVKDYVKAIRDQGKPAGVASHIPEVIDYIEDKGWDVDFYMCCFYNLSRTHKEAPAQALDKGKASSGESFLSEDPTRMCRTIQAVRKPCIAFKILGAGRQCDTDDAVQAAFRFAYANIKKGDVVNVGMFQKHKNQVKENADLVRKILK
jgi:hypothetical protein